VKTTSTPQHYCNQSWNRGQESCSDALWSDFSYPSEDYKTLSSPTVTLRTSGPLSNPEIPFSVPRKVPEGPILGPLTVLQPTLQGAIMLSVTLGLEGVFSEISMHNPVSTFAPAGISHDLAVPVGREPSHHLLVALHKVAGFMMGLRQHALPCVVNEVTTPRRSASPPRWARSRRSN
jgi:hypothetical protein